MGGEVNTDLRPARGVVVLTSGVHFQSRDGRAGCTCAGAAIGEGVDRDAWRCVALSESRFMVRKPAGDFEAVLFSR